MTEADVIAHWRSGARNELQAAKLLRDGGQYPAALFHCHLAVEKALKAAIMEKTQQPHARIHNLARLARLVSTEWAAEDADLFDLLSSFVVVARYDDPLWAETQATADRAEEWVRHTEAFLSSFLP